MYPGRESNPHGLYSPTDFKSVLSTDFNTRALKGAGGRSGYLHGVHFGFTTFSRITGRLIISIRIQDYPFRHTGMCREKGIRTLVTIARKHAFQACSISLSDTSLNIRPDHHFSVSACFQYGMNVTSILVAPASAGSNKLATELLLH